MLTALSLLGLGFALGMRHAVDADHVIAVSTIVTRQRSVRAACGVGVLWGVGHTLTILVVGGAMITSAATIPENVAAAAEFGVGVMLIMLGLMNLSQRHHAAHRSGTPAEGSARVSRWRSVRPLAVGVIHGLAGSSAVALLVLATIREPMAGLLYLALFGAGTIAGMTLVTLAIATPLTLSAARFPGFASHLRVGSGILSLCFGLFMVLYVGQSDGLLGEALAAARTP